MYGGFSHSAVQFRPHSRDQPHLFTHIKWHYYASHATINPTGVVPKGPQQDFMRTHDRQRLPGKGVWQKTER